MHSDLTALEQELWRDGFARVGRTLTPEQCRETRGMYSDARYFRRRVSMAQYRFGQGEYQYLSYPLPPLVQKLRQTLYRDLAPIASRWMTALRIDEDYPPEHADFLAHCAKADQTKATPLLLKYGPGDFNCLHQDLYGKVAFPFQVIFALSEREKEYSGGELLLVEQRPRAQSKGQVLVLEQGEGVVITTRYRPVPGTRGTYRANVRHGVSTVSEGERFTLGVIFHDAE